MDVSFNYFSLACMLISVSNQWIKGYQSLINITQLLLLKLSWQIANPLSYYFDSLNTWK